MENKRGYHVTIVENESGRTVNEFDTKAIQYVHLFDVSEEDAPVEKRGVLGCTGIGMGDHADGVNPIEMLSMLEGLQGMIKKTMEDNPELELWMRIVTSSREKMED